jgi:hypothetical protein
VVEVGPKLVVRSKRLLVGIMSNLEFASIRNNWSASRNAQMLED